MYWKHRKFPVTNEFLFIFVYNCQRSCFTAKNVLLLKYLLITSFDNLKRRIGYPRWIYLSYRDLDIPDFVDLPLL